MPVEHADPDVPPPTSLIIEPILPQHREIVTELMKKHGGSLDANDALFPQGTTKRFIWARHEVVHVAVEREKNHDSTLIWSTNVPMNCTPSYNDVCMNCSRSVIFHRSHQSSNEILIALNESDDFILAIVQIDGEETTTHYIKHPFQREPDFDATSVTYNLAKLLKKAQE